MNNHEVIRTLSMGLLLIATVTSHTISSNTTHPCSWLHPTRPTAQLRSWRRRWSSFWRMNSWITIDRSHVNRKSHVDHQSFNNPQSQITLSIILFQTIDWLHSMHTYCEVRHSVCFLCFTDLFPTFLRNPQTTNKQNQQPKLSAH